MEDRLLELEKQLRELDQYYYQRNESKVSDVEYDKLLKEYNDLARSLNKPEYSRVGYSVEKGIKLPVRMYSISNTYDTEDLSKLLRKWRCPRIAVQEKIDGLAVSVEYRKGKLHAILTRGDGYKGEVVSHKVDQIEGIPVQLDTDIDLVIHGEVFITKDVYSRLKSEGLDYTTPRHAASGLLRNNAYSSQYPLSFSMYQVALSPFKVQYYSELLYSVSESTGIPMVNTIILDDYTLETLVSIREDYIQKRDKLDYDIDGLVIKVDDLLLQRELGYTQRYPKYMTAWKFPPGSAQTRVDDIIHQVGRVGQLVPVAIVSPVKINSLTVSRINLYSPSYIVDNDIRVGDTVEVILSGDVIPKITNVLKSNRSDTVPYTPPETCPICGSRVARLTESTYVCTGGLECKGQVEGRLRYFVSREALDLSAIGPKLIGSLVEIGVNTYSKLLTIDEHMLEQIGIRGKKASNILSAITSVRNTPIPLYRVILGLSIPLVGKRLAKSLSGRMERLTDLLDLSDESLSFLGPKTRSMILDYINHPVNRKEIIELDKLLVISQDK